MKKQKTTLFENGSSQAVQLPKEFRFKKDRIYIYQEGDKVVLSEKPRSWRDFFENTPLVSSDFMNNHPQSLLQKRR